MGPIRGTAVRNERGNKVRLTRCLFEENSSESMGGVFNRGTMKIEDCVFRQNTGKVSFLS